MTDCVFRTTGSSSYNTALLSSLLTDINVSNTDAFNEVGQIKVKPTGQLDFGGLDHIFAIGDVSTLDSRNQVMQAAATGEFVANQIIAKIKGKVLSKYKPAKDDVLVVSLGRYSGVSQMPKGMFFGDFMTSMIKSGDLFTNKFFTLLHNLQPEEP